MTNITQSSSSPFVLALQNSTVGSVTGDGTVYQAVYNAIVQGGNLNNTTGVFTCTIPGTFLFLTNPEMTNLTSSASSAVYTLVTTLASYTMCTFNIGAWRSQAAVALQAGYVIAPMNVNDTAHVNIQVSNTTKSLGFGNGVPNFAAWRLF